MVGATTSPLVLALGRLNHAATRSQRALRAREEGPEWGSTPAPCPRMGRRVFYGISRRLEGCKRTVRNPLQGLGEGFPKPPAWDRLWGNRPVLLGYCCPRVPRFSSSFLGGPVLWRGLRCSSEVNLAALGLSSRPPANTHLATGFATARTDRARLLLLVERPCGLRR